MPEVTSDRVDDELRRIAEALTAEAPAAPPLAALRATGVPSTRRPWRAAVVVAAAAVALVAGVVAVVRLPAEEGADKAVTVPSLPRDPSDRLILGDVEWLPDGTVRRLGVLEASDTTDDSPRPVPGGGLLVVRADALPDPIPEGFDEFEDITYTLTLQDAAGEVVAERPVDFRSVAGVGADEAFVVRRPNGTEPGPPRWSPTTCAAAPSAWSTPTTATRAAAGTEHPTWPRPTSSRSRAACPRWRSATGRASSLPGRTSAA